MNRDTNKKRIEKIAENGALEVLFVTAEGLEIITGIPARTFENLRSKTPQKRTMAQVKKAIENGEMVGPPYTKWGRKRLYAVQDIPEYMGLFPKWGVIEKEG
jgi:hypothetical protein